MTHDLERYRYHSHQGWPVYDAQTPSSPTGASMTHDPLTWDNLFGSMRGVEFTPSDYERGQRDMLAKCISAVKEVRNELAHPDWVRLTARDGAQGSVNELKRIQRALQEKP